MNEEITSMTTAGQIAGCPCHDQPGCPGQEASTVSAGELADLAALLTEVDQFLRCGNGVTATLTGYYATRTPVPSPYASACTLIDMVSFTASRLRSQAGQEGQP